MIAWTDDCCGKKDYDGPLVDISTRYWPRGGGFFIMRNSPGEPVKMEGDETRPNIRPSARASIMLHDPYDDAADITLAEKDFEGETFEAIKEQVERWVCEQEERVHRAMLVEFGVDPKHELDPEWHED